MLNEQGGRASVEVAVDVQLLLNGLALQAFALPDVFVRRLVENAALVEVAASKQAIINGKGFPSGEL